MTDTMTEKAMTIKMDSRFYQRPKIYAARKDRTTKEIIIELIARALAEDSE